MHDNLLKTARAFGNSRTTFRRSLPRPVDSSAQGTGLQSHSHHYHNCHCHHHHLFGRQRRYHHWHCERQLLSSIPSVIIPVIIIVVIPIVVITIVVITIVVIIPVIIIVVIIVVDRCDQEFSNCLFPLFAPPGSSTISQEQWLAQMRASTPRLTYLIIMVIKIFIIIIMTMIIILTTVVHPDTSFQANLS